MALKEGSGATKYRHKKLVYSFSYLTCGRHAWQTLEQREETLQKIALLKGGAEKNKQQP